MSGQFSVEPIELADPVRFLKLLLEVGQDNSSKISCSILANEKKNPKKLFKKGEKRK